MALWTPEETAEYLRLNREVLRRKAKAGEVPGVKLGAHWRFRPEVIEEWLAQGCPTRKQQPTLFD